MCASESCLKRVWRQEQRSVSGRNAQHKAHAESVILLLTQ